MYVGRFSQTANFGRKRLDFYKILCYNLSVYLSPYAQMAAARCFNRHFFGSILTKENISYMKKAINILKTTFVWLVILLAISMMIFTVVSVTTFNRNDRDIFGYKMYIVN